jgi:hypothetical protein
VVVVFDESVLDSFDDVGISHLLLQIGSLVNVKLIQDASRCERRRRLAVFPVDKPILWLFFFRLFLRPRGLRFPTPRFRVGLRMSRVALAVALFAGPRIKHITSLETGICHEKTAKPMIRKNLQNGGRGLPVS